MQITIDETIITLADAAKQLPRRRRGRKVHVSCMYRWSKVGCRGVLLETIQVGGTRCTSREALQRFLERLSSPSLPRAAGVQPGPGPAPPPVQRSFARRQRESAEAGRKLAELGA